MVCVHGSSCLLSGRYTPLPGAGIFPCHTVMWAAFQDLCVHQQHFQGVSAPSPATQVISRGSDHLPSPCNYSDPSLLVGIVRRESVREPCFAVTELVSELRWYGEEFRCILIGLGGLKRSCACLQPVSVNPCVLEEQPQPWGALQPTALGCLHCTSPKALLLLQWVFLMLAFGGCKTRFHIQEGAEVQQCSVSLSTDGDVHWEQPAWQGGGQLEFPEVLFHRAKLHPDEQFVG